MTFQDTPKDYVGLWLLVETEICWSNSKTFLKYESYMLYYLVFAHEEADIGRHVKCLLYLLELTPLNGVKMWYDKGRKRYKIHKDNQIHVSEGLLCNAVKDTTT